MSEKGQNLGKSNGEVQIEGVTSGFASFDEWKRQYPWRIAGLPENLHLNFYNNDRTATQALRLRQAVTRREFPIIPPMKDGVCFENPNNRLWGY